MTLANPKSTLKKRIAVRYPVGVLVASRWLLAVHFPFHAHSSIKQIHGLGDGTSGGVGRNIGGASGASGEMMGADSL